MRVKTIWIAPLILACAGWAQTPPARTLTRPVAAKPEASKVQAAKPVASKVQVPKPAVHKVQAPKPAARKPQTAVPGKARAQGTGVPKLKTKPMPRATPPATASAAAPQNLRPAMRRDPFVSPVVKTTAGQPCSGGGKKCLGVDEIELKGVAKTDSGMLAMVENRARKAYILRENDPVFNGYVVKITLDSVVFRENVMDRLGHQSTRDVVKKILITPVG